MSGRLPVGAGPALGLIELQPLAAGTLATAEVLGVCGRTIFLDWKVARAWLERRLA